MKIKPLKIVVSLILVMVTSCNEPETVITNIVHPDGSVTRKLEMRSLLDNDFRISDIQVPFDSTWSVRDSVEINDNGDTIWVKRAEKLFTDVNEINRDYLTDSSANNEIRRRAEFRKRFKWFNTEYRFAEIIERTMEHGYPVADFLNEEELKWFYTPENIAIGKLTGADSIKFRALSDSVDVKSDKWMYKSLVAEWIAKLMELAAEKPGVDEAVGKLKQNEDFIVSLVIADEESFDSLWLNDIILREIIGEENTLLLRADADSAAKITGEYVLKRFLPYRVIIRMPGEIIGTNGFIDSARILLWPTNSNFFLTEPYVMYAESKTVNKWAWIVSGIFLLFVLAGVILWIIKR